ncbi:exported hypothetical protein [Pseudomonas sp. IT-P218]
MSASSRSSSCFTASFALVCALAFPAAAASCNLVRDLCNFSCAFPRCFSSLASSFSASAKASEQAFSRCSSKLPESCWSRCNGVLTGFLVADMVYLLAGVSAAHTRPLLLPPLGHLDSIQSAALQRIENVLCRRRSSSPLNAFTLA